MILTLENFLHVSTLVSHYAQENLLCDKLVYKKAAYVFGVLKIFSDKSCSTLNTHTPEKFLATCLRWSIVAKCHSVAGDNLKTAILDKLGEQNKHARMERSRSWSKVTSILSLVFLY